MINRMAGVGVALLVALGVGWAWGTSGRSAINRVLKIAELRESLLEGRAAALDARLDIYSVNFGDASRHLEAARSAVRAADARLNDLGRQEDAKRLTIALTRIDDAQRMAGQLNQDVNALAADAAKTIDDVLGSIAKDVLDFPDLKTAALGVGGKYGKGYLSCRNTGGTGWSAPATVRIEGGSVGFQIGASSTDLIMLVMSERGAEKLLESKFTLGAEGSVAVGPVGRTATAQTDAQMHTRVDAEADNEHFNGKTTE